MENTLSFCGVGAVFCAEGAADCAEAAGELLLLLSDCVFVCACASRTSLPSLSDWVMGMVK